MSIKEKSANKGIRIGILKEKKFALFIFSSICLASLILSLIFVPSFESKLVVGILLLFIYLLFLLGYLAQMQWYLLDDQSVTVKNVYGVVNKVYYIDVTCVCVKKLPIHTSDEGIPCLVFDDGRKEKGLFNGYNVDNHKKYVVRIPYTQETEEYLKTNHLRINKNAGF